MGIEQLQNAVLAFFVPRRGNRRQLRRPLDGTGPIAVGQLAIPRGCRMRHPDLALDAGTERLPLSVRSSARGLRPSHLFLPPVEEWDRHGSRHDVA